MVGRMHALRASSGAARMPSLPEPGLPELGLPELAALLGAQIVRSLNALAAWCARGRERTRERAALRAALAEMDDRLLQDIGISRAETWVEVEKFWRP